MQKAHDNQGYSPANTVTYNGQDFPLPPMNVGRWVTKRKTEVINAVKAGAISLKDVFDRWGISEEEYESWVTSFKQHGEKGLRTTRLQYYRS